MVKKKNTIFQRANTRCKHTQDPPIPISGNILSFSWTQTKSHQAGFTSGQESEISSQSRAATFNN